MEWSIQWNSPTPLPSNPLLVPDRELDPFLFHSLPADTSGSHGNLHQLTHLDRKGQGGSGGHWRESGQ